MKMVGKSHCTLVSLGCFTMRYLVVLHRAVWVTHFSAAVFSSRFFFQDVGVMNSWEHSLQFFLWPRYAPFSYDQCASMLNLDAPYGCCWHWIFQNFDMFQCFVLQVYVLLLKLARSWFVENLFGMQRPFHEIRAHIFFASLAEYTNWVGWVITYKYCHLYQGTCQVKLGWVYILVNHILRNQDNGAWNNQG